MKGPGLPGFRKQQGSGFYKSNPIPMTARRSPMKQGENESGGDPNTPDWEEVTQERLAKDREWYNSLSEEEKANIDWEAKVSKTYSDVNEMKTVYESQQKGVIKGKEVTSWVKPGDPGYEEWLEAHKRGASEKFYDREIILQDREEIIEDPDKEYTNFTISYNLLQKTDNNDMTPRYKIGTTKDSGIDPRFGGELSNNDIEQLVKDGKFKFKTKRNKKGELVQTNELFMSKDYYENEYKPQLEMLQFGQKNLENWHNEKNNWYKNGKQNIEDTLNQEFPNGKGSKGYGARLKQLRNEFNAEGENLGYFSGANRGEKSYISNGYRVLVNDGKVQDWMLGDPNYGQTGIGLYNDDEMLSVDPRVYQQISDGQLTRHLSNKGVSAQKPGPDQKSTSTITGMMGTRNKESQEALRNMNRQGWRPNDWEFDPEQGKYVIKDGAKTLHPDVFKGLSYDDQQEFLASFEINEDGSVDEHDAGFMMSTGDGGGQYKGSVINRRRKPTKYDHLLTSVIEGRQNLQPIGNEGFVNCIKNPELCVEDKDGNLIRAPRFNWPKGEYHESSPIDPESDYIYNTVYISNMHPDYSTEGKNIKDYRENEEEE